MLSKVKVGVSRMAPASARRPKRPPVTVEHMHALYRGLILPTLSIQPFFMRDYGVLRLHPPRRTADPWPSLLVNMLRGALVALSDRSATGQNS
jgi:hypothetical protein